MNIGKLLRTTEKGRLSYDRQTSETNLKELLSTCSFHPKIHVSPKFALNISHEEEKLHSDSDNSNQDNGNVDYSQWDKNYSERSRKTVIRQITEKSQGERIVNRETVSLVSWPSDECVAESIRKAVAVTSPEYGKSRVAIHRYQEELRSKTFEFCVQKQREFEDNKQRLERSAERRVLEVDQKANFESLVKIQNIELKHQSQAKEIDKQYNLLKETHEHRKQIHDAQIQEAEITKRKLRQEELLRKEKERLGRLEELTCSYSTISQLGQKLTDQYKACAHQQFISDKGKMSLQLMGTLLTKMAQVKSECEGIGDVLAEHFETCGHLLEKASQAYELVQKELELAEVAAKEAEVKQIKLQQQQEQQQQQQQQQATTPKITGMPQASSNSRTTKSGGKNPLCWDEEAFSVYADLQKKLSAVDDANQVLNSTPELKKLKFDIQKAVNTPINAISDVSGDHLRDKLKRLLGLVQGNNVEVAGHTVTVCKHQQLPMFCKNLIAKMVVKKGDEQVSSKFESAFAIAMVSVGVWREHPDIGDLFLAHFYAQCPYLVPYYPPKLKGQTDEQFFRSRGYKYEDGEVEKQDKFLKRMSGMMRLYFAVLLSMPPRGDHPHGLQHGWLWFTRVLNLEPEPDISATMIYDFLQVLGHVMLQQYGLQFKKLLNVLCTQGLPMLRDISTPAGTGAVSRLEALLQKCLKLNGVIPLPEGHLPAAFWSSQ